MRKIAFSPKPTDFFPTCQVCPTISDPLQSVWSRSGQNPEEVASPAQLHPAISLDLGI